MRKMDESSFLIELLTRLSNWLTQRRGLPIVIGIILIAGGGILEFINISFENSIVAMIEVFLRNVGIIVALVGIALLEPLGT